MEIAKDFDGSDKSDIITMSLYYVAITERVVPSSRSFFLVSSLLISVCIAPLKNSTDIYERDAAFRNRDLRRNNDIDCATSFSPLLSYRDHKYEEF